MAKEVKRVSYVPEGTIVNGVDVSDCCYIQEGAECEVYQTECEAQVCYYQQLKRKERECESYKMSEAEGKEINAELEEKNKKLKQELKEQKILTKENSDVLDKLNYEIRDLKTENEKLKKENEKLRQIIDSESFMRDMLSK